MNYKVIIISNTLNSASPLMVDNIYYKLVTLVINCFAGFISSIY